MRPCVHVVAAALVIVSHVETHMSLHTIKTSNSFILSCVYFYLPSLWSALRQAQQQLRNCMCCWVIMIAVAAVFVVVDADVVLVAVFSMHLERYKHITDHL